MPKTTGDLSIQQDTSECGENRLMITIRTIKKGEPAFIRAEVSASIFLDALQHSRRILPCVVWED